MTPVTYHGATSDDAKAICIVLHGRNQTQHDMMQMIVGRLAVRGVRYALPKTDGVGWYDARAIDPLSDETVAQVADGLSRISDLIASARKAD